MMLVDADDLGRYAKVAPLGPGLVGIWRHCGCSGNVRCRNRNTCDVMTGNIQSGERCLEIISHFPDNALQLNNESSDICVSISSRNKFNF